MVKSLLSESSCQSLIYSTLAYLPSVSRSFLKVVNSNFKFQKEPISQFDEIFQFIYACRKEKGQALSMKQEDLQNMAMALPESYLLFSVRDGSK